MEYTMMGRQMAGDHCHFPFISTDRDRRNMQTPEGPDVMIHWSLNPPANILLPISDIRIAQTPTEKLTQSSARCKQ
jgi:hypothetical protein